jgi:hypothetical protein
MGGLGSGLGSGLMGSAEVYGSPLHYIRTIMICRRSHSWFELQSLLGSSKHDVGPYLRRG